MDEKQLLQELNFKTMRSSGAGGQHVNKVSSKVELHFQLDTSLAFSATENHRIQKNLATRLSNNQELILQCEESRSQHRNKELVIQRFLDLVKKAIVKPKPRRKTKPTKASKLKRLRAKKIRSEKKKQRRNPLND